MSTLLKTIVEGETVYIEAEPSYGSEQTGFPREVLEEKAKEAFEQAKTTITCVTKSMITAIRSMEKAVTPDEFALEFSIKFSADGQAIIARTSVEANLTVTMTYKHKKD